MSEEPPAGPPPLPPDRRKPFGDRHAFGIIAACGVGWLLTILVAWSAKVSEQVAGMAAIPGLVLIPMAMGVTAAYLWRRIDLSVGVSALYSLWITLLSLIGAAIVLYEGVVCLVMAFPVLYVGVFAGVILGRALFRYYPGPQQIMVFPLLAFLAVAEQRTHQDREGVVVDEIRIQAPPALVWPHVLAFDRIPDKPDFWLFKIGLPYPESTTNTGNAVGSDRACNFSGNAVFREKIAEFVPERRLTFDIVEIPPDPELLGHLSPHRGQFALRDNGDGTTTLIGSTWYTLHVRPSGYFQWWTEHVFRAVHLRVMNHVRNLAEAEARPL